jgi:hypothetical protein
VALAPSSRTVVTIAIDGATQNILIMAPPSPPVAAVVMFPGGDGRIGIRDNGAITRDGNFLIRTRDQWLARGLLFVAVDAADARIGTRGDRVGPANLRAIAEIVRQVRLRAPVPIWLLGTSAGAPAAVAGAAALPRGAIAGAVISSPISIAGTRDSVFDAPLGKIGVPILIQVNAEDSCRLTPPINAAAIKAALTAASVVDIETFRGGDPPRSEPCEAFARHGFLGIEGQVVNAAANWMLSH